MNFYNTGNPVPSNDPRDLDDNAKNLDLALNTDAASFIDRKGIERRTINGYGQEFSDFLSGQGWSSLGLYSSGISITSHSQTIEYHGQPYSLKSTVQASIDSPYVTSGTWASEINNFKLVGDNSLRQDLFSPDGADLSGFDISKSYRSDSVGANLKTILKSSTFVEPLGSGLDDSANINAIAQRVGSRGDLFFSGSDYNINETVTVLENQAWHGSGGQRGTKFIKTANCDMIIISNLGRISDFYFEGVGQSFTGKGIRILSGFSQNIDRCRSVNMGGEPLYFDIDAGGGCSVTSFEGWPTNPTLFAGIAIAGDTGPNPRFFKGLWLSGANFALGPGAGNGCSVISFYIRNLSLHPTSTLCHFIGGRCATISDTTYLQGFDHTLDGVAFSGPVVLRNAQGINIGSSCTIPNFSEESASSQYNSAFIQRRAFTPSWTQSGSNPSIGNGVLNGDFVRAGNICHVQINMFSANLTSFGDSASAWAFSIPFPGHPSIDQRGFPVRISDSSAGIDFTGWATIGANQSVLTISVGSQSVRSQSPMVWASGDSIQLNFSYMTR